MYVGIKLNRKKKIIKKIILFILIIFYLAKRREIGGKKIFCDIFMSFLPWKIGLIKLFNWFGIQLSVVGWINATGVF